MEPIASKTIRLRPADRGDAAFILSLRNDARLNAFLSPVEDNIDKQQQWLIAYEERHQQQREYYFIVESLTNQAYGTVRLYDFRGDSFAWGSWILLPGTPPYVALESAIAVYDFAFDTLRFARSHFDVRKGNQSVIRFHERFGALVTGEDADNLYFQLLRDVYYEVRPRYAKMAGLC